MHKNTFSDKAISAGKKACLVSVSTLAITAFAALKSAAAAPVLLCTGMGIRLGQHIACGTGNYVIEVGGGVSVNGCLITLNSPQRARCTIQNTGAPTSRPVLVTFTSPGGTTLNDGGNSIQLDIYRMRRTTGGPTLPSIIFTSGEVNAGTRFYVGSRVRFMRGSSIGTYSGVITINATPQ